MDIFPTSKSVVRSAVLIDGATRLCVVSAVDVDGEYANGEYAFGLTLAKVYNPFSSEETFYLASGDLPNGGMFSGVFAQYLTHPDGVEVFVHRSYDWTTNHCTPHTPSYRLWLPSLCSPALEQLDTVNPINAFNDDEFDMDVVALLEDCGFWPWSFHFADPTTNFMD